MKHAGAALDDVIARLTEARAEDFTYRGGEILGSMCTAPDAAAEEAARLFLETNLGDPGHFPGTRRLETEYLSSLLTLANAPPGARALLTSGGTESNLLAVHAAREAWKERQGDARVRPRIVVPETAHFSFEKARRLTDVTITRVPVDENDRAVPEAMAEALAQDACLLVAVAGTTETGAIDPIDELAAIARDADVPLHVDAALGGFMLPFLAEAGRDATPWDFQVPGVETITLDPHKMGTAAIPAGALAARDAAHLERITVETPYVTTDSQASLLGTRPGFAAAAAWAAAEHLGREGHARITRECLENADHVRATLDKAGVPFMGHDLNVVLVHTEDPLATQSALSAKGWRVNAVPRLAGIRLVIMPHVQRERLDVFLADLLGVLEVHPTPDAARPQEVSR